MIFLASKLRLPVSQLKPEAELRFYAPFSPFERDAMSAAVFKKYNVVEPLEGSQEFVEKAQSIFSLNDSALAPFVSMKAAWKPLPEDPIQRPYNCKFCM